MNSSEIPTVDDTAPVLAELKAIRDLLRKQSATMPVEMLGREDMAALLGCGQSTFDRLRATGAIGPRPVDLGGPKWHRAEVLAWLAHRDHRGELHDAKSWPAIWKAIRK